MTNYSLVKIFIEKSNLTNKGITFIESSENEDFISYNELYLNALNTLSLLQNRGIKPQDDWISKLNLIKNSSNSSKPRAKG